MNIIEYLIFIFHSDDVDELGMYGLCHMIEPHIHKYKVPNANGDVLFVS